MVSLRCSRRQCQNSYLAQKGEPSAVQPSAYAGNEQQEPWHAPLGAKGRSLWFPETYSTRHIRTIYLEDVPNLSEIFMHASCNL